MKGDWGIYATLLRKRCKPIEVISISSIKIEPFSRLTSLNKAYKIDDFPAPVLPTIPTFILGSIITDKFLTLGSRPAL